MFIIVDLAVPTYRQHLDPTQRSSSVKAVIRYAMTSATPARGLFIVLEGLDRSGKTTQVARLEQSIKAQGKTCRVQKFPGETSTILGAATSGWEAGAP